MNWTIEFERSAAKEFRKLDVQLQHRIREFFQQRILPVAIPDRRARRYAAAGWVGCGATGWVHAASLPNYDRLVILIVRVGQRGQVYR